MFTKSRALVGAGLLTVGTSVFAAVPADVTTALADAKTDAVQVAGLVIAIVVAVAAFKFMKRAIG